VSLNVSDIERAVEFYVSILGFRKVGNSTNDRARLFSSSSTGKNSMYLIELLSTQQAKSQLEVAKRASLCHFAILLPKRQQYLEDILRNLNHKRHQVHFDGLPDHLVSEAIYIREPDLNGIKIYCNTSYSEWKWKDVNCKKQLQMTTLQPNTQELLRESTEKGWTENA
jgi:catechol 2,3-dioxygenase